MAWAYASRKMLLSKSAEPSVRDSDSREMTLGSLMNDGHPESAIASRYQTRHHRYSLESQQRIRNGNVHHENSCRCRRCNTAQEWEIALRHTQYQRPSHPTRHNTDRLFHPGSTSFLRYECQLHAFELERHVLLLSPHVDGDGLREKGDMIAADTRPARNPNHAFA